MFVGVSSRNVMVPIMQTEDENFCEDQKSRLGVCTIFIETYKYLNVETIRARLCITVGCQLKHETTNLELSVL
jgi:hypothetical protein